MTRLLSFVLLPLCAASAAPEKRMMDLARLGTLSTWGDRDTGVEWRDVRDVHEIRVRFKGTVPRTLKVQYWHQTWPGPAPVMPKIEDPADDPWQGQWLTAEVSGGCRNSTCSYTFQPLAVSENPLAANLPGVRYRRTLKVRLVSDAAMPPVAAFEVFSDAEEKPLSVRIGLGYGEKKPARWSGSVEVSNGRLSGVKPLGFGAGDGFKGAGEWSFMASGTQKGLLVDLIAAAPKLPGSLDRTLVTVRAKAGDEPRTFTFDVEDLKRGPIYIPDFHAYVTSAAEGEFQPPSGRGPHIRALIPKEPEQTLERASREIAPLDPWQNEKGERVFLVLAPDSSWQKFAFEYGGNVYIRKDGTKAMGKERERLLWEGDQITWRIGTGKTPYYRDDRKASISTLDGYLPVIAQRWENEGLGYTEEAFATVLRGPLSPDDRARSEQTAAILMLRLTAENRGSSTREGHVWLSLDPGEDLRVSGRQVHAIGDRRGRYDAPRLRAVSDTAGFAVEALPGSQTKAAHFAFSVPAGSRKSVVLKLPFVSDLTADDAAELERLDYDGQRTRVTAYWKQIVDQWARFSTPEPKLNLFLRAVAWHIRMSTTKDPVTGLYMVPAASYRYKVYANETCSQVLTLDALGEHGTAAAYLETLLRLQGSKNFPGLHRGMEDAILHGVRVNDEYDYTAHNYGLDHPTVLWTLGEHYLYTRDKTWFEHAWPHMEKAIAWIEKQRAFTRQVDASGRKVREYGLMPASALEDNKDWANWFSINAYTWAGLNAAARALQDVGHPKAQQIREEADGFRSDLRAAVLRAAEDAPVTQMRDGTYAPYVPSEPYQRFRRFGPVGTAYFQRYGFTGMPMMRLSADREVLVGPLILLHMGVFGAKERAAEWMLDDWEDNLTLSSGLGINVHGITDERYWFSQGGMVFQPNLQNPILIYLRRGDAPAAIRALFNNFTSCYYPEPNAFTEEYHMWGRATGPFYKVSDEAGWVNRMRDMLILEDGESLYLARGVPRRWLASKEGVRADRMATHFGPVSYTLRAGAEAGTIAASVQMPSRNAAKAVWLVVRPPEGRIQSVTLNGKPWTEIDAAREAIKLPQDVANLEIGIRYR